jgi:cytosine/adenosine deaminase-related metal-dependent hydrolase
VDAVHLAAADVVVVSSDWAIADGALARRGDRVVAVGPREVLRDEYPDARETRYRNRAILPSFVNAHTHLCLSHLAGLAPYDGDFAAWLQCVLGQTLEWTEKDHAASLDSGLVQAVETATGAMGDILNDWTALPAYESLPIGGTIFLQVTGFNPVVADVWMAHLGQVFNGRGKPLPGELRLGISPHAPYSTSAKLYRECAEFAEQHDLLLMTHLAETLEEERFLSTGTGIYRRMLRERGTWVPRWRPPKLSPAEYFESEGLLSSRCLYAHVNYPSDTDLDLLAKRGCTVVYCPRSHAFFRHAPHRFDEMVARGIRVALGTDSLASNHSLEMLEEVRLVRQRFPALPAATIFSAGTLGGAEALRITDNYGTLEPGRKASYFVADLGAPPDPERVLDQLLAPEAEIEQVVAWGRKVHSRPER